jgi:hypothetical protein
LPCECCVFTCFVINSKYIAQATHSLKAKQKNFINPHPTAQHLHLKQAFLTSIPLSQTFLAIIQMDMAVFNFFQNKRRFIPPKSVP